MTNYFPIGLFIWLLIYLFKEVKQTTPLVKPDSKQNSIEPESKKQVQYISNGRLLNDTLFFYYYDMLRLTHIKHVNEQTIVKYAYNRYALINKIDYDVNWPIAKRDVKAAKAYVLDRWNYMTNLN